MALIKCENLSLAYDNKIVMHDLSFEVNNGDYLCIVGENGSGKSTLMKAILGLMKPSGGTIDFGEGLKQTEIGYLPQQNDIQKDFPASVYEVVLSGTLNSRGMKPFYSKKEKSLAKRNMDLLNITDFSKKCYHDLSGGQQQRVLLARAMCATKKLLLLDEPVTGLDPVVTTEMYKIIKDLNEKQGITIIMISHDIAASTQYASHILHLHHRPLFFGTTADYIKSDVSTRFIGGDAQ